MAVPGAYRCEYYLEEGNYHGRIWKRTGQTDFATGDPVYVTLIRFWVDETEFLTVTRLADELHCAPVQIPNPYAGKGFGLFPLTKERP